jgi:hypothetical protein
MLAILRNLGAIIQMSIFSWVVRITGTAIGE